MLNTKNISKRTLYLIILLTSILTVIIYYKLNDIYKYNWNLTFNDTIQYPYIAVIVDDRATELLVNAVLNILQHIPIDWKVQIITRSQNWLFYTNSSLASLIKTKRVFLTPLNHPRANLSGGDFINLVLTSVSFWRQVRGDKVLFFQIDSVICSNSSYKLTDFLQYDFIGAPWSVGGCCNGGFSVRNRMMILKLLESGRVRYKLHQINEDGWFTSNLRLFNGHIAPVSIAKTFSVETMYYPGSFAVHNPYISTIGAENMHRLCQECPEVRTISRHCQSILKTSNSTD